MRRAKIPPRVPLLPNCRLCLLYRHSPLFLFMMNPPFPPFPPFRLSRHSRHSRLCLHFRRSRLSLRLLFVMKTATPSPPPREGGKGGSSCRYFFPRAPPIPRDRRRTEIFNKQAEILKKSAEIFKKSAEIFQKTGSNFSKSKRKLSTSARNFFQKQDRRISGGQTKLFLYFFLSLIFWAFPFSCCP